MAGWRRKSSRTRRRRLGMLLLAGLVAVPVVAMLLFVLLGE
jgi:hypothetical protein